MIYWTTTGLPRAGNRKSRSRHPGGGGADQARQGLAGAPEGVGGRTRGGTRERAGEVGGAGEGGSTMRKAALTARSTYAKQSQKRPVPAKEGCTVHPRRVIDASVAPVSERG